LPSQLKEKERWTCLVTIEGTVTEIIFTNDVNGYTVCEITNETDVVIAVGYMPFLNAGEVVRVSGTWLNHPDYGMQLKVEMYEKKLPDTAEAIEKYLASGVIKGIGPATAAKIVKKFGNETLNIIQHQPQRLSEIKGISLEKAMKIGESYAEQSGLSEVIMFFQEYGISPAYSTKIYKMFGENTIAVIRENPYKLVDETLGISFKTADKIAMSLGIDRNSKFRVMSGIKYVLSKAVLNGHTYVPDKLLKEYTSQLLEVEIDNINDALVTLAMDKSICTERDDETNKIYLAAFYNAEQGVCRKIAELSSYGFKKQINDFEKKIAKVEAEEGIILAEAQKTAVREALSNGVLVITGGPGTGKTTIIKAIIRLFHSEGCRVALAAPTGRAAKRMSEATGFEAKTIHRLLEIGYTGDDEVLVFNRTEENPLDADAVIIDETSMVDILLMYHLLKAIRPGTRLILVGDVDQLPSVGAGNVLKDIIESGVVQTVKLTEIFRQAEESMIIVNAHKINKGEYPYLNEKGKDFFFIPRSSAYSIVQTIVDLCARRIPKSFGYDPARDIQVLTPTKKGMIGVAGLNVELQKVLNPEDGRKKEKSFHGFTFREGDRVMQIKNNYNLKWKRITESDVEGEGVFNGDMGVIRSIDFEERIVTVLFDDDKEVQYDFTIMDEIEPAFAVTIHKSQGSEFPVVILPVFPGPAVLMTRNLLYTAVTRAKNLVILVGIENSIKEMIDNKKETERFSSLMEKLKKAVKGDGQEFSLQRFN